MGNVVSPVQKIIFFKFAVWTKCREKVMEGVRQNQTQFTINEIPTQIVITSYHDRHFVIVTQIKKIGTLVSLDSFFRLLTLLLFRRYQRKVFVPLMGP
jgi:hypothetical protein